MTDIQCPHCGHRALSVATRCPRCGHEFSSELLHPLPALPKRTWLRPTLMAAGGMAVVVVLALLARSDERSTGSLPAMPQTPPPAPPSTPSADTASLPSIAAPRTVPLPSAEPPPAPDAARRYATNWINVRERRGLGGRLVLVLKPGDSVMVDSLVRGWYRVVAGGRTVGYAHRRFLARTPADTVAP